MGEWHLPPTVLFFKILDHRSLGIVAKSQPLARLTLIRLLHIETRAGVVLNHLSLIIDPRPLSAHSLLYPLRDFRPFDTVSRCCLNFLTWKSATEWWHRALHNAQRKAMSTFRSQVIRTSPLRSLCWCSQAGTRTISYWRGGTVGSLASG